MRYVAVLAIAFLVSLAQPIHARTSTRDNPPQPHDGSTSWVRFPPSASRAPVDTTYILGGPGNWGGSFETPGGLPDWHGWTHEDLTVTTTENHWHVSTYWAEYIAGHGLGNHALYCGDETIPACAAPDTIGGVGPGFLDDVEWTHSVADPSQPVTVRLTGLMNFDLPDAGWDFLELFIKRGFESDLLGTWTGTSDTTVVLDFTTVLSPGEFTGPGSDEVLLFWRVWTSLDGWDDTDCINPSHGACQIDDLAVFLDDYLITFDDFEPGNPVNWNQSPPKAVGDFTNLRNDLGEIDPCLDNTTWQVNFVDDGVVVPGTGGTPCWAWCYDPGGWMVNNTGGLLRGDENWFLENQVVSPPIAWPEGNDGAELAFDVYRHETLGSNAAGIFYLWNVRSTDSTDPADLELAPWVSRNSLYNGGPEFLRHDEPVSDLMVPDRQWVQIALGVNEAGWQWGWNGPNGTPAPYFDNVSLKTWAPEGPEILVTDLDLFGDSFPEKGALDPVNLEENWCRLDRSQVDIASPEALGDSLVARITPLRDGAVLPDPPSLHWVMDCNPTFDTVRPESPDGQGILRGMVSGELILGYRWSFDLPDSGWFFPGDRLHYYITASGDLDGDLRTSVWPPDTTAVLDFTGSSVFPRETEIHALPTLTQPAAGQFTQPSLLFCDGTGDPEAADVWFDALRELGLVQGVDYDLLSVYRYISGIGIGALATVDHLAGYQTMIHSSGSRQNVLNGEEDSNDAKLVSDWLALGGKNALLAGDCVSSGLANNTGGNDGTLLLNQLGVHVHFDDIAGVNGVVRELQISPVPENGLLPDDMIWQVGAGCPEIRKFDAITAMGNGQISASLDPEGTPDGTYASVLTVDDQVLGNRTAVVPFDLERVSGMTVGSAKNGSLYSAQAYLLSYLLAWFDAGFVSAVGDLPGIGQVVVSAHPNPFNPSTTISFDLPRAAEVSLDIYDLQGRLVRRLLDESPYIAGNHKQVWDGRDAGGQTTASGVYFYRFEAGDQRRVGKLTLLK